MGSSTIPGWTDFMHISVFISKIISPCSHTPRICRRHCTLIRCYSIHSISSGTSSSCICTPSWLPTGLLPAQNNPFMGCRRQMLSDFSLTLILWLAAAHKIFTCFHNPCSYSSSHRISACGNTRSTFLSNEIFCSCIPNSELGQFFKFYIVIFFHFLLRFSQDEF